MDQNSIVGKNILGYTVVQVLGSGAFGTVYKVIKNNPTGQYVRALKHIQIPTDKQYKTIYSSMGGDIEKTNNYFNQILQNIVSEVQILNELSNKNVPNIVRYYENDVIIQENPRKYNIYILMEYLTPLEDFIPQSDFTVRDVIYLGLDILNGLKACHDNKIIHRDIKIDNIFVSEDGQFKIGDFGISKELNDSSRAESIKGTPDYLAPEVYLGREGYTNSIDLYSLGILLYRLLNNNRNPFLPSYPNSFTNDDEIKAFEARMKGEVPPLPLLGGEHLGEVVLKAISNKDERFQNAKDFYDALEIAAYKTSDEDLDTKISDGFASTKSLNTDYKAPEDYTATVKDLFSNTGYDETTGANLTNPINREVFQTESIETPISPNSNQGTTIPPNNDVNGVIHTREPYNSQPIMPEVGALPPANYKKWILIILAIILGIAAIGFGIYFVLNKDKGPTTISSPTYTVSGGDYENPQEVQIQTNGDNLTVYYTINGSEPTESSTIYTPGELIEIDKTTTLKSIAVDANGNKSPITSVTYNIESSKNSSSTNSGSNSSSSNYSTGVNSGSMDSSTFNISTVLTEWPFYDQSMLRAFDATASSTLPNYGSITYYPSNVLDNDSKTAWTENASGLGIGESITLTYKDSTPYDINNIYFLDGYTKDQDTFNSNSTPTQLTLSVNGSKVGVINLQDTPDPQVAHLPFPITIKNGDRLTFTIDEVTKGINDKVNDTNISEIRVFE